MNKLVNNTNKLSSNNNLKSLEIGGYTLSPEFSKDTLEYFVEVPNGTTSININSTREDNTASISGNGEVSVNEGSNKIELKVQAENGNVKVYVINVTVKELAGTKNQLIFVPSGEKRKIPKGGKIWRLLS